MKKPQSQSGFTLSEVLIVIAILLILVGVLVGFGKHLKRQAEGNLCECTIGVLIAAIEQYHDWHDAFPDPDFPDPNPTNDPVTSIENLYDQLYSQPKSCALCEQIQKSQIGDTDSDKSFEFLDPWGKPLRYRYVPGWTFPVVESGGPDRDLTTAADNISSK